MDSESTAQVIDMPHVAAGKAEKAAKKAQAKGSKAPAVAEAPKFGSMAEGAEEAVGAYEAKQRAEADRTAVGKRFGDRIKQANEKLKTALEDESKTEAGKTFVSMTRAKAKATESKTAWEEAAQEDSGAIGKAYRALAKVKEERAEAKDKAAAKVEKTADRFGKVMEQLRLSI